MLLLGLLNLLLNTILVSRFALLHQNLIYRLDVDIVSVTIVVRANVLIYGHVVCQTQIRWLRRHHHRLLKLLLRHLIFVVCHHQHAVCRVQNVRLIALQREINKLLSQIRYLATWGVLALVTKSTHRYLNIAKLLNVINVIVGHERPWHIYVIVLSAIVDTERLLGTSPTLAQFVPSLRVAICQYIYDWNFRWSVALHVLSHDPILVDGFVLTFARKHLPFSRTEADHQRALRQKYD